MDITKDLKKMLLNMPGKLTVCFWLMSVPAVLVANMGNLGQVGIPAVQVKLDELG